MILQRIASGALAAALLCGPALAAEAKKPAGQDIKTTGTAEAVKAASTGEVAKDIRKKPRKALREARAPQTKVEEAGSEAGTEPARQVRKADARRKGRKTEAGEAGGGGALDGLIAKHAKANGIPEDLVHRVIKRESRYNPRAVGRGGTFGLMQIKHGTARALGYAGTPDGLLSADTNLTYGVRYLAGAYKVANGDPARAVAFFARGYYYDAKRKGVLAALPGRKVMPEPAEAEATTVADVRETASTVSLFEPMPAPYFADPK
ncbi:MAG TPA: lytic transglycosylase domain-containing protein [Beijerinckiaceae bacterium]|jgi:soluble lytic murein transglycosylase-like protein